MNIRLVIVLLVLINIIGYSQNSLEKGLDYFEKGDYNNAIINFDIEIENKNNLLKAYHNRGRAYFRLKNYYQASRDSDKSCQLGDCTLKEYIISNKLYQKETVQESEVKIKKDFSKPKNVEDINENTNNDLRDDIKRLEEIAEMSSKIQDQKKYKNEIIKKDIEYYLTKIDSYNKKIRINNDINAYYSKGLALYNNNDYGEAASCFDKVIISKTDYNGNIYFYRGFANLSQEKYSEAIDDFTEVISKKLNFSYVYFYRGRAYYEQEDYSNAIKDFTKMLEINPDMEEPYYYRACSYDSENDFVKAIKDFTKVIEINPKHERAYTGRGYSYISLEKFFEASRDADKSCELGECLLKETMKETEIYQ